MSFLQPFKLKNPKEEEKGNGKETLLTLTTKYSPFRCCALDSWQFSVCSLKQTHSLTHPLTQLPEIAFYIYYTIRQKEKEREKEEEEWNRRGAKDSNDSDSDKVQARFQAWSSRRQ